MQFQLSWQVLLMSFSPAWAQDADQVTVYVAKNIITMDPGRPNATAVAVRDRHILAVGSEADMKPWTDRFPYEIDRTFADKILVPGFIAAHEHPLLAATSILRRPLVAYYPTPNPFGPDIPGVKDKAEAMGRLKDYDRESKDKESTIFAWGYDTIAMGGHLTKVDLDAISETRPILVWDASIHFAYGNSAFLKALGVTAETASKVPGIELGPDGQPNGQFLAVEAAIFAVLPELKKFLANSGPAVDQVVTLNRQAGITTTTELALGKLNRELEEKFFSDYFNNPELPMRIVAVASGDNYAKEFKDEAPNTVKALAAQSTDKVIFSGVKFFSDDAFLGLSMALKEPGYLDPTRHGIWNTEPKDMVAKLEPWWKAGFRIHVHTNGDASQESLLNAMASLQAEHPRLDHGFVFEHFGLSTPAQIKRLKTLGAVASVNPSYLYLRGELNAPNIGADRAALAARLGTLVKTGVPTAIHSDLPVAPADPLLLMWMAVNRFGQSGKVLGPEERVTAEQALRMVTIDAAYVLGVDDKLGSIEPGKFADFAVLESDPLTVPSAQIRDIPVWGTVFSGAKYPAPQKQP